MKLFITAKPRSREESVERIDDAHYIVRIKAVPVDDKANEAIVKLLADFFKISKTSVQIISGHASRHKRIDIMIDDARHKH